MLKKILKMAGICIVGFILFFNKKENNLPDMVLGTPDVISSMGINDMLYLKAVANCDSKTDYNTVADTIINMYTENAFHSTKFSTDVYVPNYVSIDVYADINNFEKGTKLFRIEYFPFTDEYSIGYE